VDSCLAGLASGVLRSVPAGPAILTHPYFPTIPQAGSATYRGLLDQVDDFERWLASCA
jgi:hypothetical protein